jgi:hypothetical protein
MFQNQTGKFLSLSLTMLFAACTASISQRVESSPVKKGNDVATDKDNITQSTAGSTQTQQTKGLFILTIKVEDLQDAREIPNAQVMVSLDSGKHRCRKRTGPHGIAKIKLSPGEADITVIAPGYKTHGEKKDVRRDEDVVVKLVKQ